MEASGGEDEDDDERKHTRISTRWMEDGEDDGESKRIIGIVDGPVLDECLSCIVGRGLGDEDDDDDDDDDGKLCIYTCMYLLCNAIHSDTTRRYVVI